MKISYCLESDAFQTGCRFHAIRVQRLDVMALKIRYYITLPKLLHDKIEIAKCNSSASYSYIILLNAKRMFKRLLTLFYA